MIHARIIILLSEYDKSNDFLYRYRCHFITFTEPSSRSFKIIFTKLEYYGITLLFSIDKRQLIYKNPIYGLNINSI